MTGTAVEKRKYDYTPLGTVEEDRRAKIINGALAMLAEDMTLVDVAAHYSISKSTLIAALTHYAEDEWKGLQVARAQVAVQRAAQKRMEIAAQLDEFQAAEKAGEKTTETALTYPRVREQLRIAEHDEKSAQWHLERLHRRLYGSSMEVRMTHPNGMDPALVLEMDKQMDEIFHLSGLVRQPPPGLSASELIEWRKAHPARERAAIDAIVEVVSVETKPQPPAIENAIDRTGGNGSEPIT